ncbi:hypothetical protein MNBD_GAMMA12-3403 [hydrothermal vent metagenome]|uniref:Uncharacterized protein n=1 Tax=hydrothermal vent metagenome TaxID=652676 RepID=A0A3B0YF53_9ZZZZ
MMNKDESITRLIEWITSIFGSDLIEIIDYWEGDLCAIGIRRKGIDGKLLYISTFGKVDSQYDFECEEHCGSDNTDYDVVDKGENVTKDVLKCKIDEWLFTK